MPIIDITMNQMTSALAYLLAQPATNLYFYIEYGNVETPETELAIPTVTSNEGIEYYVDLESSECCDFIRVPVVSKQTVVTDSDYVYPNSVKLFANAAGTVGVHGRPFSHTAISKIVGAALVLVVDDSDYTQDMILQRWYYDNEEQIVKTQNPIGISRTLTIGV